MIEKEDNRLNKNELDLTISIVNTNNKDMLKSCLKSIYDTTKKTSFEVIVADNFSTDGSIEMIKESFPEVIITSIIPRNGYGFCHNRAYEKSQGRYFLLLNEDMIILPEAIDIMVEKIKKDKMIGALGCKLLNPDGTLQISCSRFPSILTEIVNTFFPYTIFSNYSINKFRQQIIDWDYNNELDVDCIMGSCMLIPRKIIEIIGLFDERFYIYSEEVDLCKRIKNEGLKVHFTPESQIIHFQAFTTEAMSEKMYVIYLESRIKYFKKYHTKLQLSFVKLLIFFRVTLRMIGWWIVIIFKLKQFKKPETKFRNYRAAFLWFWGLFCP